MEHRGIIEMERAAENNTWLNLVEAGLITEPLVERPEWFDESEQREITREMLMEAVSPYGETIANKLLAKYDKIKSQDLDPREGLNPFRGNNLTKLITPAQAVFESGAMAEESRKKAEELFGAKRELINARIGELMKIIEYRKLAPHRIERLNEMISDAKENGEDEKAKSLSVVIDELKKHSRIRPTEIKAVFAIGKLTDYVIREAHQMDQEFITSPEESLKTALGPIETEELPDYYSMMEKV